MNEGMFNAIMAELQKANEHLNEIRLAANRMDGRLKEHKQVVYVPQNMDVGKFIEAHDLKDVLILPLPAIPLPNSPLATLKPKPAGPTDPQAQMREMVEKKGTAK